MFSQNSFSKLFLLFIFYFFYMRMDSIWGKILHDKAEACLHRQDLGLNLGLGHSSIRTFKYLLRDHSTKF